MRRAVLTFGSISGVVAVLFLLVTIPLIDPAEMWKGDLLGYASMVVFALLVFFGIRSHRENAGAGRIGFGRALTVGLLISLVSTLLAVIGFEIIYFHLMPEFGDKFQVCMVERARASGASPEQIETVAGQARTLKRLYDDPWTNAALTFATTFPIGLVGSLIAALILRRR